MKMCSQSRKGNQIGGFYFDGTINVCGNGAGAMIISLDKEQYPNLVKLQFECTNNRNRYEVCILGKVVLELNIRKIDVYGDYADYLPSKKRMEN